jgi:murein DD-endopeptidase MepM/ murein hydrolase activator NlpD
MKLVRAIALLALAFGASAWTQAQSDRGGNRGKKAPPKSVGTLRNNLNQVQRRQSVVRRELRATKAQATEVRVDLNEVDTRIGRVRRQIGETQVDLKKSRTQRARVAESLAESQAKLEAIRAQLRTRLAAIYTQGPESYVSVLAGTRSTGEFVSRASMLEYVAVEDRKLFDRYALLTAKRADQKRAHDQVVARIDRLQRFQRGKEAELADARQDKAVALRKLETRRRELERILARYEADERSINASIRRFLARARKPRRPGQPLPDLPRLVGGLMRPVSARMSSGFGMRFHPILRRQRMHNGVDFAAPAGTSIRSAADGVVVSAAYGGGYGNRIIIFHGDGVMTVYAHCRSMAVREGQRVRRGQVIGTVGSTGMSTGPHLHFEVRVNGRAVNPMGRL